MHVSSCCERVNDREGTSLAKQARDGTYARGSTATSMASASKSRSVAIYNKLAGSLGSPNSEGAFSSDERRVFSCGCVDLPVPTSTRLFVCLATRIACTLLAIRPRLRLRCTWAFRFDLAQHDDVQHRVAVGGTELAACNPQSTKK